MDDWRTKLAAELLGDRKTAEPFDFSPSGLTALEIAFGQARSEVTYVLELGRAHGVPVVGNVIGDDVWLRLGATTVRFAIDRNQQRIVAQVPGRPDDTISWDGAKRSLARAGEPCDIKAFVRSALDATVAAWKKAPAAPTTSSTARELPAARGGSGSEKPPSDADEKK